MSIRIVALVNLFLVCLLIDATTKLDAPTSGWTWHPTADPPNPGLVQWLSFALLMVIGYAAGGLGATIIAAGVLGNVLSDALMGGSPNMLIFNATAYNYADMLIYLGSIILVAEAVHFVYSRRLRIARWMRLRWRLRLGRSQPTVLGLILEPSSAFARGPKAVDPRLWGVPSATDGLRRD